MDVEELELKIAFVGLVWSFLQNEIQKRHVAQLRPGRNIVKGPIVRKGGGATTSEMVGDNFRLMEENCDLKTKSLLEISCGWSSQCLMSYCTIADKQNTWYRQAIGPGQ